MTSIPLFSAGAYNTIGGVSNFTDWQHKTLQQQLHENELHKHSLNQRLVEMEAQNRAFESQVRDLTMRDQEQHQVILNLQSQKEELVRWIEGKQREYDGILQQAHIQIDQMKNDNIRLQQDNQRLLHENQLLEQRLKQSETEHTQMIAQLKYQNEQAMQKIQMADHHIGELNVKHQDNHRYITTLNTTKEEMERWIDNKQREHENQVRLMQQQLEQMRLALEQSQREVLQEREHFSQFEIQTNQRIQQQLAKEQELNLQLMTARQELNRQMVKDKDQHQALISLNANKDDQSRWIEAKSREYENKIIGLKSQLELANTTIQQLQHELDVQIGRYQKFELDASNLINALQQKDKDNIHLIGELQTQLSILRTSENELLKSNKKLQQERSEIFTQMEVRTREYEARIVNLTSELERVKSSSDAYQRELDIILQRYQILDRDSSTTIIKLQSNEKEHLNQISTLNALVIKLQAETNRLDVVMNQKMTELHREKDKKEGMNAINENKVNEMVIEIDNYRRLLEERSALINENEVKLSDWQKRYWTLVDQSRDEILKMGNQFRMDCDEAENRYTIRLKQLESGASQEKQQLISEYERKIQALMMIERECEEERNNLRMAVTQLQEEKRNLEAQLREMRVIGQAKDQEKTGEIFSLQATKEEILRQFQITKSEYENKFMTLSSQVEHLKANLDSTTKELQIQINKYQSLENESSIQIASLTSKESELLFQVQTLDATANRLQLENQRLDSISKQMVIELQILSDKKEDLRIIDEFQLNEKDLELGRLRRTEIEQRTRIEVLEKQLLNLQSDSSKEINRLKNQVAIQRKDLESLITKMNQLVENHKVTDKHLTVLAVDHENEINLWRARYYDKEAENGRLQSQLRLLISEVDVAWVRIGEFEQDKSGKLQKELDNMRAQFDMLSKHYEKMARERGQVDLRNSKASANKELVIIKEEYETTITQLRQELTVIRQSYSSLEEKNREMTKQISIDQGRYQEELRLRLDTLREENVLLKSDADSYLKQLESKITIINQLQGQIDEITQKYESISMKFNLTQTQLEQDRVKAQREQELILQSHTHLTQTQIMEIRSQVQSLSEQNGLLNENIRRLQYDNSELEVQLRLKDEQEIKNQQLYQSRQSELQKQIQTLESKVQTLEKERERTTTELHILQRDSVQVSNQQAVISELKTLMTRQQQEIHQLTDQITKLNIEKSELNERILFLKQEKSMVRHSTQSLELQYADVFNRITELQVEVQSKQKEIENLRIQLASVQNEKNMLISQQTQIKNQAGSHEIELKKLIQLNSRLESENVTLNSVLKVTEQERDQLVIRFEETKGSSTQVTQDLHKQIRQLMNDIQIEQRTKQELQRQVNECNDREQKLRFDNDDLRARQEGLTKEIRNLKEKLSSSEGTKDEIFEKDKKILQLKSDLEVERKRYQSELESIRVQQINQQSNQDLNKLRYEQEQFKIKEANYEDAIKKLRQEFERKAIDMDQKFSLQKQTLQANHNLELEQQKQQIHSIEQRLQNKDGEIMDLLEQIQSLQKLNRDKQNQVLEMSTQLDKVKQDHQKVTSQLVFFEEERNSLTTKLVRVSSEIKDFSNDEELRKAKQQYIALQNDMNRMQEQKDQEIMLLQNEIKSLKNGDNKVAQLMKQNQQLKEQLDRLRSDSQTDQYLNKIADLENDIEVLIEDSKSQLKKNQDLQDKNNQLQQELQRSRNRSPQAIMPSNNGSNQPNPEVYDKLINEIKVLNQKLHKYERVIGDLEQALADSHRKEDDLIRQVSDMKNRSSSPERSDLPLKVIQLEQELVQARNQMQNFEQRLLKQSNLSELQEKDEEIEVLIEQIKKNDVEIRELKKENQNLKAQLQDFQKEVSFMKDILNDSNHKSKAEPSPLEVEYLKSYVIELENKCALLALDHAAATKKNQQRGSKDAMQLQREMEEWKSKAIQLQRELDLMNAPEIRYWQAEHSQNITMSTRNPLGNLGISNINP